MNVYLEDELEYETEYKNEEFGIKAMKWIDIYISLKTENETHGIQKELNIRNLYVY